MNVSLQSVLPDPTSDEAFIGIIVSNAGDRRYSVKNAGGLNETVMARKKKSGIAGGRIVVGDIVLCQVSELEGSKYHIIHKYNSEQVSALTDMGRILSEVQNNTCMMRADYNFEIKETEEAIDFGRKNSYEDDARMCYAEYSSDEYSDDNVEIDKHGNIVDQDTPFDQTDADIVGDFVHGSNIANRAMCVKLASGGIVADKAREEIMLRRKAKKLLKQNRAKNTCDKMSGKPRSQHEIGIIDDNEAEINIDDI